MPVLQRSARKLYGFYEHELGKVRKPMIRMLQSVGLLVAVGMLIEFLPVDLAIVLVMALATQAWVWLGVGGHYIRHRRHVIPVDPNHGGSSLPRS